MNEKRFLVPVVAVAGLILIVVYLAGGLSEKIAPSTATGTEQANIDNLKTLTLQRSSRHVENWLPATLTARQNTMIASRVMANVKAINVRAGDLVEQGSVIAELNSDDLAAQVRQIKAQVAALEAQLAQATQQLMRAQALHKKGLVPLSELEDSVTSVDNLKATKMSFVQQLDQAQVTLSYTKITAPIAGRVVDRIVEPGDLVTPGQGIVALYNPNSIQVTAFIPERYAVKAKIGDALSVKIESLAIDTQAIISEIVPLADSAARSFKVTLELTPQQGLMPGMYAKIAMVESEAPQLIIPRDAIHTFGQLNKVYIVENDMMSERFIRLGEVLSNNQVVVLSGLSQGEQLVLLPHH